jgi:hypothetical protein
MLAAAIALFSLRGVASAGTTERPAAPTTPGITLVREIGGLVRTPTPPAAAAVAATPTLIPEPTRLATRVLPSLPEPAPETAPTAAAPEIPPPLPSIPTSYAARRPELSSAPTPPAPAARADPPARSEPAAGAPTSTPTPAPTATSSPLPIAASDIRPAVSIALGADKIDRGDRVSVTVSASDDRGIDWKSWEGLDTGDWQLDSEHRFDCINRTKCVHSWTVAAGRTGNHALQALARDSGGQRSAPVNAQLRVREDPTPTPTPTRSKR